MLTKKFNKKSIKRVPLVDIISTYNGIIFSADGMPNIYNTLEHITGKRPNKKNVLAVIKKHRPIIEKQFPEIKEIDTKILMRIVKRASKSGKRDQAIKTWLCNQEHAYGKQVSITSLA